MITSSHTWFTGLVDTVDTSMRVWMRVGGLMQRHRIGETFFGAQMHCDIRDFIQRRIYFFHIYESNLTHYMEQRVGRGDVVVDVGANVGYVTLLASTLVGARGKVYAIEAAPRTYDQLSANLELNQVGNVSAHNVAATGVPCRVEIVTGEKRNIGSNSTRVAEADSSVSVPGRPVSDLLGDDISRVGFLKIDVEGGEAPILDDILANLGRLSALRSIAVEISTSSSSFIERFQEAGFRAYAFPNNYRIGAMLVRKYLERTSEDRFVMKIPVAEYCENFTDYVFEREV